MCRRGKKNRRISDSVKLFKIIAIIHIFHKIKKIKIFSKKVLTFLWKAVIIYLVKRTTAKTTKKCRSGGIGRRAGFRCLWSQDRVGSSPISCILFYFIQNQKNRSAQHRHFCFFIYFSFSEKISLPPQRSAPVNMKRSEILNTTFLSFGFSTFRLI